MDLLIQVTLNGIAQGCVYALVALGFVLVFKATGTLNIAQGELMMVGAYTYYALISKLGLPWFAAFPAAVLIAALLGAGIERGLMHKLTDEPEFILLMATAGLAVALRSAVGMIFSHETVRLSSPIENQVVRFGGSAVALEELLSIGTAAVLALLLFVFFRGTRLGIAMRAVSQNRYAAQLMGINVAAVFTLTWALSTAVAAVGGILLAHLSYLHTNMGFVGLRALPAAVLGGLTSIPGALLGGLIIGLVENLSGTYLDPLLGGGSKEVVAYIVLLGVLLVRPTGILGLPDKQRV